MSGGYFDHEQYKIREMADDIDNLIQHNDDKRIDEYGDVIGNNYSEAILTKYKEAVITLRMAEKMVQRIDYLESGDDGEDDFLRRWREELG